MMTKDELDQETQELEALEAARLALVALDSFPYDCMTSSVDVTNMRSTLRDKTVDINAAKALRKERAEGRDALSRETRETKELAALEAAVDALDKTLRFPNKSTEFCLQTEEMKKYLSRRLRVIKTTQGTRTAEQEHEDVIRREAGELMAEHSRGFMSKEDAEDIKALVIEGLRHRKSDAAFNRDRNS